MAMDVGPGNWRNKYHVRLSLGADEAGLILCNGAGEADATGYSRQPAPVSTLRTYTGSPTYGDLDPFWTPVAQDTWTGGRGNEYLDRNGEAYFDGSGVDTLAGRQFTVGGLGVSAVLRRTEFKSQPYTHAGIVWNWVWMTAPLGGGYAFRNSGTVTVRSVELTVKKRVGTLTGLWVRVCPDAGGVPGAAAASVLIGAGSVSEENIATTVRAALNYAASGTWWVQFEEEAYGGAGVGWDILAAYPAVSSSGRSKRYSGAAWVDTNWDYWGRALDVDKPCKAWYFELRRVLFALLDYDDGSGVVCYMNGAHDLATGGGSTTLARTGAGWWPDVWKGAVVKILSGPGFYQAQNYRTITGNTSDTLTVSPAWDSAVGANTEFMIVGTDVWQAVGGMPATVHVSDVEAVNEIAYIGRTSDYELIRLRRVASGGSMTNEWVTEAGNRADQLCSVAGGSGAVMWRSMGNRVSSSGAIPDGSGAGVVGDLAFGADAAVGGALEWITNLIVYDEDQSLFVFKPSGVYKIVGGVPVRMNLGELRAVGDDRNGAAAVQSNVYLIFSLLDGLERYYKSALDDVGPNLGAGLPVERQGAVTALCAYPGRYYAAVSGGAGKRASVLCNNGQGWHEVWRAPVDGEAIRGLWVQSVPGQGVDRLWISCGTDVWWLPIAISGWKAMGTDGMNPYVFRAQGHLITSRITMGVWDVAKFWQSVKIVADWDGGLAGKFFEVDYRTDVQPGWVKIPGTFDVGLSEKELGVKDVMGSWIQLRVRVENGEAMTAAVRTLAVVVKGAARARLGHVDSLVFRLTERGRDLNGAPDGQGAAGVMSLLTQWAGMAQPVWMEAGTPELDGRWVFLEPPMIKLRSRSVETGEGVWVCQMALREI